MSYQSVEQSLAKYHLLHFLVGAIFSAILLAIPKNIGVIVCVALLAIALPPATLPELQGNRWLGSALVVLGAIAVALIFYFFGKL
jgi:hypothetical protein